MQKCLCNENKRLDKVWGLGLRVKELGFRIWGLGIRILRLRHNVGAHFVEGGATKGAPG